MDTKLVTDQAFYKRKFDKTVQSMPQSHYGQQVFAEISLARMTESERKTNALPTK